MISVSSPYKLSQIFASSAGGAYITNPIPNNANNTTGAAGADQGFPPITGTSTFAGGIPPSIEDFNGIFYYVTAWNQWQQAGAPVRYDATFSSEIGGYPSGAIIAQGSDSTRQWLSLVDNNASNPDTGGANWADASIGRLLGAPILLTSSVSITSGMIPPGTRNYMVELVGGGGAGGYAPATTGSQASVGSGGNSGARVVFWVTKNPVNAVLILGAGGITSGTTAGAGGDSSWQITGTGGGTIIAKGGVAGGSAIAAPPPTAAGGSYSSGSTGYGAVGTYATVFSTNSGEAGGTGIVFTTSGTGGGGLGGQQIDFGNGGGGSFGSGAGAGTGYGSGGGGGIQAASATGQAGGNGSAGAARLWCYS